MCVELLYWGEDSIVEKCESGMIKGGLPVADEVFDEMAERRKAEKRKFWYVLERFHCLDDETWYLLLWTVVIVALGAFLILDFMTFDNNNNNNNKFYCKI
ncbi:hypothetical protein HanLR1_Chr15g0569371 [Helianthus annuus]|nr:hypothetical protein HanHA89_Chr15g0608001 [Helianthus annuus]KAJ0648125.1 hypothetical protein HanLR1_Chr15g0569371 [Helianthus annuus]